MSKLDFEESLALERFASRFRNDLSEYKKYTGFINYGDEEALINQAAIEILERKFKEMANASSLKELNKVIKVKKIIKDGAINGEEV